jgi:hypothetical protein
MPTRQARAEGDRHSHLHSRVPPASAVQEAGPGWTLVLRRQPTHIVNGEPEGGYTDLYELVCCYCGDHPDLDYRDVSPELQRIRGPYPIAAGIAACGQHAKWHPRQAIRPRRG